MEKQFDELSKSLAECVSRRQALRKLGVGITLLAVLGAASTVPAQAEDLYVNASAKSNGSGNAASPYWRITDAVVRARSDRNTNVIPATETITIHVAAGTYTGSFFTSGSHLEMLPIVLNVPNLVLQGVTALNLDSGGLPTGAKGPQSILATSDGPKPLDLAAALVTITHTTDGGAGDGVTVAGFTFRGASHFLGIIADHVSRFAIARNLVSGAYANVYARASTGVVSGNQLSNGNTLGFISEGGTALFPANVTLIGNRINNSSELGAVGVDNIADTVLNLGRSGLTALPFQFAGSNPDLPNGLTFALTGNDMSLNGGIGVRLFVSARGVSAQEILGPGAPTMSVVLTGNSMNYNGRYGLVVDGGDAPLDLPSFSATVRVSVNGNSIVGNGRQPALFTFYNYFDTQNGANHNAHLEQAVYNITDLDGELTGFDYYNPPFDPVNGAPNNNMLVVNGSQNILGIKLTSKP